MDHWVSEVSPVRSGRDHTGKFKRQRAGRLGSPAGPAVSLSTGGVTGQRYSETQLSVFICWFTGILWSSCMKSHHTCILRLLMVHFSALFLSGSFQYLKIMCQTHASAVSLPSVYLGEKFTHSLSQSLRASAALWCEDCCFVLPFEVMESSQTMITQRSSRSAGNSSRNSVYERFTSIPLESLCSRCASPMPFCSQWQPPRF